MKEVKVGLWGFKWPLRLFDSIVLCWNKPWKPTRSSSLFKRKTNLAAFQFHFDFIFPPLSKSFILFQHPINPFHIHWALVAPFEKGFLHHRMDLDNLLTFHNHTIVAIRRMCKIFNMIHSLDYWILFFKNVAPAGIVMLFNKCFVARVFPWSGMCIQLWDLLLHQ